MPKTFTICALSLLLHGGVTAQSNDVRGWSIAYGDGRVTTQVLKAKGGLWTPVFPKVRTRR